jgi:L-seryl-tRNA(Ser) seleniumtransferase
VLASLHNTMLAYLARTAQSEVPFWRMASLSVEVLGKRAEAIIQSCGRGRVINCDSLPGAGSAPGISIKSVGITLDGDHLKMLRHCNPAIIARVKDNSTIIDLRTIDPSDDALVAEAFKKIL